MRITETSADLPILLALYSSFRDRVLPSQLVCFGEVGLSGEVRPVHDGQERLKEAQSHGYEHAVIPKANAPRKIPGRIKVHPVDTVAAALECIASLSQ
jgi:DNA repair protein RadA/Sms